MDKSASIVKAKLTIAYNGQHYSGWQIQTSGIGVQQRVEEAVQAVMGERIAVHSSSRTDAGVHALGMVAHLELPAAHHTMEMRKLAMAINAHLPEDIRVLKASRVRADFHARFEAKGKQYRYFIWNHFAHNPLLTHSTWHVTRPLDLAAMRKAATEFLGKQDFRSFAANRNYPLENSVRRLTRCDIQRKGHLITCIIEGDGFLYKMCRGIVGTLAQVGLGRYSPDAVRTMLEGHDRRLAGMTAPAHGLVLWKVFYHARRSART